MLRCFTRHPGPSTSGDATVQRFGPASFEVRPPTPTQPSCPRRRGSVCSSDRRTYCYEALEELTVIAGLVSAAAITGSLLFLARQTRQSVEQFLVANELAGGRALAQGYELWDHVIDRFIEYPELRQYFYDGVEVPE